MVLVAVVVDDVAVAVVFRCYFIAVVAEASTNLLI